MKLFHKHRWIELERFYAPPNTRKAEGLPEFLFERMLFGVTTILYKCSNCSKIKTIEVLGQSLKEKKP